MIVDSLQAKNGFYIFKLLKKAEKNISWYVESIWNSHLNVHKGLENTTTPLTYILPIVCIQQARVESSCTQDHMAYKP